MAQKKKQTAPKSKGLHPRNPHRQRYDFPALIASCPELKEFVAENRYGDLSVNFSDPNAVKALNKALLRHFYQIDYWDIPAGFLCPPIPGRADYIHYLADLLAESNEGEIPTGKTVTGLDIGVGANCVYPIVGHRAYGWRFVGADVDPLSIKSAKFIVESNKAVKQAIKCRLQRNEAHVFTGMINPDDVFDFTMCNPPFHASLEEAQSGTERKVRNLAANSAKKTGKASFSKQAQSKAGSIGKEDKSALNFGGQKAELWCDGGEAAFIERMIKQSVAHAEQVFWFTTLVSKKDNLAGIYQALKKAKAKDVRTIEMAQGQKLTRVVAWTFLDDEQQQVWREERWAK
ncbi:23S rRNA (adenine(1618)-N(6))-methyltransferase [Photobacterium jeanii]|uniref:Ribosomal RNA large subunit methyltransferase F n=1 Tax=Photobacterium jeanii TaxID=858640 RepID=A0A178K708_9GAMM|nr:23S rRNA (adenine(1618)-N(6))-methyltransferase RlmF [Photobacterium jeanii]OAN13071.1 23S rRNA (adenine(1618)-N(6))-methyltransferase [Photobacterium jeanii]PST89221.1 23S rRNA (adenine(1618)-N(6))-methyltransferase RlmF [Photobacterium jeanii]